MVDPREMAEQHSRVAIDIDAVRGRDYSAVAVVVGLRCVFLWCCGAVVRRHKLFPSVFTCGLGHIQGWASMDGRRPIRTCLGNRRGSWRA